jgi:glycosyltransferase involved in cell wall biosynthesis
MSVRILALVRNMDTCFYYRIDNPFRYLDRNLFDPSVMLFATTRQQSLETDSDYKIRERDHYNLVMSAIAKADIVIMQRGTDEAQLQMVEYAKLMGKKVIYESDDDYLHVPTWNPGHVYFGNRQVPIRKMIQSVDMMTVSTEELRKTYSGFNKNIRVLPNCIDFNAFDSSLPQMDKSEIIDCSSIPDNVCNDIISGKLGVAPKVVNDYIISPQEYRRRIEGKTVILWSGSPTHEVDLEQIVEPMQEITRGRDDVVFVIGGFVAMRLFSTCSRKNMFLIGLVPMSRYYSVYKTIKPDIILAPLVDNQFNRGKSNLRVIETMALKSYPIASNVVTYREWINAGRLAGMRKESWMAEISCTLFDKTCDRWNDVIYSNNRYVRENFCQRSNVKLWEAAYSSLL